MFEEQSHPDLHYPHSGSSWPAQPQRASSAIDVRQLKAEIAAIINWYDAPLGIGGNTVNRIQLLVKLRKLYASIM
jgi:hypothetical protein